MSGLRRQQLPLAFLLGFVSLAAQGLLFREHLLVYAGNEIGMGGFLASWMLWIGVGALLGRGPAGKSALLARGAFLLLPVAFGLEVFLFWHLRRSAGVPPGGAFPLGELLFWTALAACPVSTLSGYLFTRLARHRDAQSTAPARAVLRVYAVEALGSALGGTALTVACWGRVPTPWLIIAVGLLWWAWLTAVMVRTRDRSAWIAAGLTVALAMAAAAGLPAALEHQRRLALPVPSALTIEATVDTPYQHLAVARIGSARVLLASGDVAGLFPDDGAALDAAILHTLAPPSPRTLIIGLGAPALVCELVKRSDGAVVYVGVDREGLDFVAAHVPELQVCLAEPRLQIVAEEPLRYLEAVDGSEFDLVVYAVPEPRTAQSARFYTEEFLGSVAGVMSAEGVLSLTATATENVLTGATLQYIAGLNQTLGRSFPQVGFAAGEHMRFFAGMSGARLTSDPEVLEARFKSVSHWYPDVSPAFFATRFEAERIRAVAELLSLAPDVPSVTRNRPGVYLHKVLAAQTEASWLVRLSRPESPLFVTVLAALGALLAALLLSGRRGGEPGRLVPIVTLIVAGMTGMAGQVLILLGYQSRFGTLFAEFGLLNALFLAGLAVGGLIPWSRVTLLRKLAPVASALACLGLVGLLELESSGWVLRIMLGGAPLALGICVGAGLSIGLTRLEELGSSAARLAVSLEFLDHAGAVAGALLAGTLLVPLCGLVETGWLLVAAGALPAAMAVAEALGWRPAVGGAVPTPALRICLIWGLLLAVATPLLSPAASEPVPTRKLGFPAQTGPDGSRDPRSSWPLCKSIPGWGGPLELLVEMGDDGTLTEVQLGRQIETPEYLFGIGEWLGTMRGLPAQSLCYGCPGNSASVDAFTGATVTGEAVVAIVRCVADPAGLRAAAGGQGPDTAGQKWRFEFGIALVVLLLGGALYWTGLWWLRTGLLILLAAVGGLWLNQQLSLGGLLAVVAGPRPPLENAVLWLLCGGALLWGILGGAIHCGYLCPAGAAMSLLSRLGLRWRLPEAWDRTLRQVKYGLAATIVWGLLLLPAADWTAADLLRFLFRGRYDTLGLAVLAAVALGTLIWLRPWCRYFCPLGALLSVCEKGAVARRLAPHRRSSHCHHGVVVGTDWDCVRCNRCVRHSAPDPRFHRPGLSRTLAVIFVGCILVLGGLRVVTRPGQQDTVGPKAQTSAPPPALPEPSDGEEESPPGPRLYRRDNKAYPVQRRPGARQLEEWLRAGRISDEPARFFVPVPDSPAP